MKTILERTRTFLRLKFFFFVKIFWKLCRRITIRIRVKNIVSKKIEKYVQILDAKYTEVLLKKDLNTSQLQTEDNDGLRGTKLSMIEEANMPTASHALTRVKYIEYQHLDNNEVKS